MERERRKKYREEIIDSDDEEPHEISSPPISLMQTPPPSGPPSPASSAASTATTTRSTSTTSKRRQEQNRQAQRAFRERRRTYLQELEERAREVNNLAIKLQSLGRKVKELEGLVGKLGAENAILKNLLEGYYKNIAAPSLARSGDPQISSLISRLPSYINMVHDNYYQVEKDERDTDDNDELQSPLIRPDKDPRMTPEMRIPPFISPFKVINESSDDDSYITMSGEGNIEGGGSNEDKISSLSSGSGSAIMSGQKYNPQFRNPHDNHREECCRSAPPCPRSLETFYNRHINFRLPYDDDDDNNNYFFDDVDVYGKRGGYRHDNPFAIK